MMKKLLAALCLASVSLSCAPAFAGDDPATNTVMIPVRLLSFGVGAVIGTPISIVKHTISAVPKQTEGIAEKIGGKDNAFAVLFAMPVGIVTGTTTGVAEGVYYGSKNSLDNCVEHPFSNSSISLGDKD